MSNAIVMVEDIIGQVAEVFSQVNTYGTVEFNREREFALQALYNNEYSRKIALQNPQSLRDAITNVAAIGITLNPASKLAYLVPRKNGICLDISYMGLRELATSTGAIIFAKAELVHEADEFIMNGIDKEPAHNFQPFGRNRGAIIGAYCVAKLPTGEYLTELMSIDEVYDVRDRSEAWKAWTSRQKKCPWVTDEGEMIKKTVIKRGSKSWPKNKRLDDAIHMLNTSGGEGIDTGDVVDEDGVVQQQAKFQVGPYLANIAAAQNDAEISAIRREGLTAASAARDKYAYDRIRAAVLKRRKELGIVIDIEPGAAQ